MVENEIHKDLHSFLVRLVHKLAVIVERTETGIYRKVVHNIVTVIGVRLLERREPKRINAQLFQIIEFLDNAAQISHAVAVAVRKRGNEHLITDAVFFPALRNGLLFVNSVVSFVGNYVVLRDSRARFESLVRIVHFRARKHGRTAPHFALTDKPVIVALAAFCIL